jgi:hypothetical protein
LLTGSVVYKIQVKMILWLVLETANVEEFVNSNSDVPTIRSYVAKKDLPAVDADHYIT